MIPAYRLASRSADNAVSAERVFICALLYIFGVVLMLLADSQKFYTLKYKKGLISDGLMKYTRNPNYLGEIMIYGSFILLVNDAVSYACVMQVWVIVFSLRIMEKENSLKKKDGWAEYKKRSWVLVPKVNGRVIDSVVLYGLVSVIAYWMYREGGIRETFKELQMWHRGY